MTPPRMVGSGRGGVAAADHAISAAKTLRRNMSARIWAGSLARSSPLRTAAATCFTSSRRSGCWSRAASTAAMRRSATAPACGRSARLSVQTSAKASVVAPSTARSGLPRRTAAVREIVPTMWASLRRISSMRTSSFCGKWK